MGAMLLMVLTAMAQMEDPVKFTAEIKTGKTAAGTAGGHFHVQVYVYLLGIGPQVQLVM